MGRNEMVYISKLMRFFLPSDILLKFVSNKNVEQSDEGSEFNIFIGQKFKQNTNVMLPLFEIQHWLDSIPNPQ